jgi:formylglycine-generating enzyme
MANTFDGRFPVNDTGADGFAGIAPVGQFPPTGYGLYDVAGNVWEWTSDWYRPDTYARLAEARRVSRNPKGPDDSFDPSEPGAAKRVHRGGSFLCTEILASVRSRTRSSRSTGARHVLCTLGMDIANTMQQPEDEYKQRT